MHVMGLCPILFLYRHKDVLQKTIKKGSKRATKLQNYHMHHFDENMVPCNALMAIAKSMINSSTSTFHV